MFETIGSRAGRRRLVIPDDSWKLLPVGAVTMTIANGGYFPCGDPFLLGVGQTIEIDAYIYRTSAAGGALAIGPTGAPTSGFSATSQNDANMVAYRVNAGSSAALGAFGAQTTMNISGAMRHQFWLTPVAASNNNLHMAFADARLPQGITNYTDTSFNMATMLQIGISTQDITRCRVLARVLG